LPENLYKKVETPKQNFPLFDQKSWALLYYIYLYILYIIYYIYREAVDIGEVVIFRKVGNFIER
jgi:hypothetical protein